ncbi:MAG: HAD family hydrolase [Mycobacterium leprae]
MTTHRVKSYNMYHLVALDLDGTLLGPDGLVCDDHRKALQTVQHMGLEVVLATARPWADTAPIAQELALTGPAICLTGAAIYMNGSCVQCQFMEPGALKRIATWAEREGWTIRLYHSSGLEIQSHPLRDYVNKVGAWFAEPHQYVSRLSEYVQTHGDVLQVVLLGPRSVEAACAHLADLPGVTTTIYDRLTPHARLHFFCAGVSKGAALSAYCRERNIPRQSVIAMGDTGADISMIDWAGVGVAMGWASECVRARADLVTSPSDPAPVFTALKQLLPLA